MICVLWAISVVPAVHQAKETYRRLFKTVGEWAMRDLNPRLLRCKRSTLAAELIARWCALGIVTDAVAEVSSPWSVVSGSAVSRGAIFAVVAGADGWVQVESYGRRKRQWLKTFLELPHGIPTHCTRRFRT